MNDMGSVIIPKSDQLNADDLIAGPITIKISAVTIRAGQEQPISIHFEGDNGKPYKACKSMCRLMVSAWGSDSKKYAGRSMTLFREPTVKWGGMEVGGIRISHMSDIDSALTMALTMTKGSRKPFTVRPLGVAATEAAGVEYITPEQIDNIEKRCEGAGIPLDKLKAALDVTELAMIPADMYDKVQKRIEKTIAAKAGQKKDPAPTVAELGDQIAKAATVDALNQALDLIRYVPEQFQEALRADGAAKLTELQDKLL